MHGSAVVYTFHVATGEHRFLAFRSAAAQNRYRLEGELTANPDVEEVLLDFRAVAAMTYGYADELVGRFYATLAAGDAGARAVGLTGLTAETRDAVVVCLERRKLAAVDAELGVLLGETAALDETYAFAVELGTFRAGDVAADMGISLPNANNRLKRLAAAGAVHRVRAASPAHGGKEFSYRMPATHCVVGMVGG